MTKNITYKFGFFLAIIVFAWTTIGLTSMSLKKNKQTWDIGETTSKFSMTIPNDFSAELLDVKPGHFQSMFISGPNNVAKVDKYQINIRTGYFPTYRYKEIHFDNPKTDSVNVNFLGQNIKFICHYETAINIYVVEQIISLDNVKQGLKVDINLIAFDKKGIERLIKILETLKLGGANPTPKPKVVSIDPQTQGIFSRQRQISKYGTATENGKLITGSQYYHNSDGSISKIELYEDGIYIRDSVFVK